MSGYDPHININLAQTGDRDVYQSVVVTNVDGNLSPALLRAAAMEHIKKDLNFGRALHSSSPRENAVGDFNNPALLPMIFPTLFPQIWGVTAYLLANLQNSDLILDLIVSFQTGNNVEIRQDNFVPLH